MLVPSPTSYRTNPWEVVAIAAGAVLLMALGLLGLGNKAVRNATDPQRAKAIAQNVMQYSIPGTAQGLFGVNIGGVKMAVVSNAPPPGTAEPIDAPRVELLVARTPTTSKAAVTPSATGSDFNLFTLPGLSVSYEIQGEFQAATAATQPALLCGVPTVVTIRTGTAVLSPGQTPAAASRYEASAILDGMRHSAIVMAIGPDATAIAQQVFESLDCR